MTGPPGPGDAPERGARVTVPAPGVEGGTYDVVIEPGLRRRLPELVAARVPASSYPVVADETVAELHGNALAGALREAGHEAPVLSFPPGEGSKTRATWAELTDRMLARGVDRRAVVVAVGGGITGDVAGFVAATCLRGLRVVHVPTSVVAMVDSSVGGKTGVDVPAGKNLVGAFHPPSLVVVDPETTRTLPRSQRAAGLAEVVKHGAILDRDHLEAVQASAERLLDGDPEALGGIVHRSVAIKADVVGRDEKEGGLRKILNFGHTIAHALEAVSGYRLSHGVAVAMGMVAEARLGEELGITELGTVRAVESALSSLELPVRLPAGLEPQAVVERTRTDKKGEGGEARYVLLRRPGQVDPGDGWVHQIPEPVVEAVLRELAEGAPVERTGDEAPRTFGEGDL